MIVNIHPHPPHANTRQVQTNRHNIRHRGLTPPNPQFRAGPGSFVVPLCHPVFTSLFAAFRRMLRRLQLSDDSFSVSSALVYGGGRLRIVWFCTVLAGSLLVWATGDSVSCSEAGKLGSEGFGEAG